MDISSAIVNIYKIEDMPLAQYKDLLEGNSNNYRIKLDTKKNGILIQSLKTSKLIMVKCIKEYYSPTCSKQTFLLEPSCTDVLDRLGLMHSKNCTECHRECIRRLELREINKI